ncbi:MAG: PAS domain-containing sensor histidine kinase [Desulfarculus sp.]|jgi:PAS domain S-box-containing protein|nr:MAG: PAS domain-containing sensor histidine kinase [Desulfarculus sp.]
MKRAWPVITNPNGHKPQEVESYYEMLYHLLLEAIPSSILLIDRSLRVVSANRNFLEKSRRPAEGTIGRRLEEIFPAVILDNLDIIGRIQQVFDSNQPTDGERLTYRVPGVPMRYYYYRIMPFSREGEVYNVMLLMEDITEQVRLSEEVRRVERHLSSVVESASDIVLSMDINGGILTWNTAAERVSGYALREIQGELFSSYCAPDIREEVTRALDMQKKGGNYHMAEWDLLTKQGARVSVSWVLSPMKDALSKVVGVVAVGRDLSERRKFEMQILQSQKLAALGVMAGGIAHEIRNPLAVCSSAAQFLMEDDLEPVLRRECSEKIYRGIRKASEIIENLLRFARPKEKAAVELVDLVSTIKETLSLVANQARLQKVTTTTNFPQEQVLVSGVGSLLQQVFMNLFLNAINAMPGGGVMEVSVESLGKREVRVGVTDTGKGISPGEIDKIFDPFYTTSPVGQGTGLGLSISYSIIKQHFGSIEVESAPGQGCSFWVRLPVIMSRKERRSTGL